MSEPDWRSTHRARGRAAPGVGGVMLRGTRDKAPLLAMMENVMLSSGHKAGLAGVARASQPWAGRHNAGVCQCWTRWQPGGEHSFLDQAGRRR